MEKESNDSPAVEIKYNEPTFQTGPISRLEEVFGLIPTVSAAPTHTPRKFDEQFRVYTNGATLRFYWYDATNNAWHYVTATA